MGASRGKPKAPGAPPSLDVPCSLFPVPCPVDQTEAALCVMGEIRPAMGVRTRSRCDLLTHNTPWVSPLLVPQGRTPTGRVALVARAWSCGATGGIRGCDPGRFSRSRSISHWPIDQDNDSAPAAGAAARLQPPRRWPRPQAPAAGCRSKPANAAAAKRRCPSPGAWRGNGCRDGTLQVTRGSAPFPVGRGRQEAQRQHPMPWGALSLPRSQLRQAKSLGSAPCSRSTPRDP